MLSVDPQAQRMSLSLKQATVDPKALAEAKRQQDEATEEETPRESVVKPRKGKLKGGVDRPSGGEGIGLNW